MSDDLTAVSDEMFAEAVKTGAEGARVYGGKIERWARRIKDMEEELAEYQNEESRHNRYVKHLIRTIKRLRSGLRTAAISMDMRAGEKITEESYRRVEKEHGGGMAGAYIEICDRLKETEKYDGK